MDYDNVLAKIYEHLEKDDVGAAVTGCLRIARSAKDYLNIAVFLSELYPDNQEFMRALYDDVSHLKEEAQVLVYETAQKHWLKLHTLAFSLSRDKPDPKAKVLIIGVGELDAEIDQLERSIADMVLPTGMHPFDAAAFSDRYTSRKADIRLRIKAVQTIKSRLKTRCLNYASQIERQLDLQRKNQGFLDLVQNEVNNFFKARSVDVYTKLQKAAELAAMVHPENPSLLLTEVRRALKAAADYFYPSVPGKVTCIDGKERKLGEEQYINRLQEFLASHIPGTTSKELLEAELEYLANFVRRLNNMASKGVHAAVTLAEAKQGLVGLYFFLFNVSQHFSQKMDPGA